MKRHLNEQALKWMSHAWQRMFCTCKMLFSFFLDETACVWIIDTARRFVKRWSFDSKTNLFETYILKAYKLTKDFKSHLWLPRLNHTCRYIIRLYEGQEASEEIKGKPSLIEMQTRHLVTLLRGKFRELQLRLLVPVLR